MRALRTTGAPMRHALLPLALVACTASSDLPASRADSVRQRVARVGSCWRTPVITTGGVASVRVGSTVASLPRNCPSHDTTFTLGEGMDERGIVVRAAGHEVVGVTTGDTSGLISRVLVRDSLFRTATGAGVGSTVGALRAGYGGALCVAMGDESVALRTPKLPGVSFSVAVDQATFVAISRERTGRLSLLPDSSRVREVWLYEAGLDSGECPA